MAKKLSPAEAMEQFLKKTVADRIAQPINEAVKRAVRGKTKYVKAGKKITNKDAPRAADLDREARSSLEREARAISNAASRLGKLARGIPKNITDEERENRRDRMANAQNSRW